MHLAVIGGGYWGSKHLRVLAGISEVQRLTLVEVDEERRKRLTDAFPSVDGVATLDEIIDEIDGAVVATRPTSHVELGMQLLERGKHALIEKPLATSVTDAVRLCRTARENEAMLMAGHTFEFNPAVMELKNRMDSGELGQIHYMRSLRLNLGLYQSDVNVVWDLAPHDVSIMNHLLDDAPDRVSTWAQASAGADFEDVAILRLEYDRSGVEAYVHVSWLDPSKTREVTVVGSRKMAVYDDVKSDERLRLFDRGVDVPAAAMDFQLPMSYRYGDITSPFINFNEPLELENRAFIDAIRSGTAERADALAGLRVVMVMEAAQQSLADGGRPINLSDVTVDDGLLAQLNGDRVASGLNGSGPAANGSQP